MKELLKALSDFQNECPPFVKNIQGYGYTYTGLPEIGQVVTPLLKKHGLIVVQNNIATEDTIGVESTVYHIESGKSLSSRLIVQVAELKGMNLYQSVGSAITYIRRYDMSTLLGLQSEKDDDGGTGKATQKKTYSKKKTQPKSNGKLKLTTKSPNFDAIVGWVAAGGEIEKVYEKYEVDEDTKRELIKRVDAEIERRKNASTKQAEKANE